jgi:hypothetical protein
MPFGVGLVLRRGLGEGFQPKARLLHRDQTRPGQIDAEPTRHAFTNCPTILMSASVT